MSFYSNLKGLFTDTPISYAGKIPKGSKVVDGVRVMPAKIGEIPLFQNPVANAAMADVAALDASRYAPLGIKLIQKAIGYKPAVQLSKEQLMDAQAKAMSQFDQPSAIEQTTDNIVNGRSQDFTGDYANTPIASRGAKGGEYPISNSNANTNNGESQKSQSVNKQKSSASMARPGSGKGVNESYVFDPSVTIGATAPHYVGMSKGQLEGETPIAAAPEIYTGLPAGATAMNGDEYAKAAAAGEIAAADAIASQKAQQLTPFEQLAHAYGLMDASGNVIENATPTMQLDPMTAYMQNRGLTPEEAQAAYYMLGGR